MRVTSLLLFAVTGLLLAAKPANLDPNQRDLAQLQGTWAILSVEVDGRTLPMEDIKNSRLTIRGNRYSFALEQARLEMTFTLDANATPKAIDLLVTDGSDQGNVYRGIYDLEEGLYSICRSMSPNQERPTEFATRPGSGLMMVVWTQIRRPAPGERGQTP